MTKTVRVEELIPGLFAEWRNHAHCRNASPSIFFPPDEQTGEGKRLIKQAKSICSKCRVREECLVYAIETRQDVGIWGGYTANERKALRRKFFAKRRRKNVP